MSFAQHCLLGVHPCFDEEAHFTYARVHLPVAPKCNTHCGYCDRKVVGHEHRPGLTGRITSPGEAFGHLKRCSASLKRLTVVGIAGPGEPLYNPETFQVLRLVHRAYPGLLKCLATNGPLLTESLKKLRGAGVKAISVTVNAVEQEVAAQIYRWAIVGGRVLEGREAAEELVRRQLEGIEAAAASGFIVKVNTVLIPGVNDLHIPRVAREIAERGARLQNIVPLIPLGSFGGFKAPSGSAVDKIRALCSKYIRQFRLCKLCRADACGIPGEEPRQLGCLPYGNEG